MRLLQINAFVLLRCLLLILHTQAHHISFVHLPPHPSANCNLKNLTRFNVPPYIPR